jgi:hypothetical protein
VEFPKGVLIFWAGLVLFGALYEGTWFSPSLYESIFAVGYRYESISGYVEEQERMIEIQKNGGEKREFEPDDNGKIYVEYTSVAEAKEMQKEARTRALAALREPSKEIFLISPIYLK